MCVLKDWQLNGDERPTHGSFSFFFVPLGLCGEILVHLYESTRRGIYESGG